MTILANIAAGNMRRRLTGSRYAVMTAAAVADDANVIKVRRYPACRRMAVVTGVAAGHMSWGLAGRDAAVVTRAAGTDDLCMINADNRSEGDDAVTVFADVSRLHVRAVLAGRVGAIMAARTIARNIDVIKVGRDPGVCRMAIVTGFATRDVRRRFARRDIAVVAGLTTADDLGVINHCRRRPEVYAMAVFAYGRR